MSAMPIKHTIWKWIRNCFNYVTCLLILLNFVTIFLLFYKDFEFTWHRHLWYFSTCSIIYFCVEILARMFFSALNYAREHGTSFYSKRAVMQFFYKDDSKNGKLRISKRAIFDFAITILSALSVGINLTSWIGIRIVVVIRMFNGVKFLTRYRVRKFIDHFIDILILLNLVVAFMMTSPAIMQEYSKELDLFCLISIAIFVLEVMVRIIWPVSKKKEIDAPFSDDRDMSIKEMLTRFFWAKGADKYWNCFDFLVTFISVASLFAEFASFAGVRVLRLVRLLNSIKIFQRYQQFRLVSEALVHSLPAMASTLAYFIVIYSVYTIIGVNLFRESSPEYFGDWSEALYSLFQLMTLDNWGLISRSVIAAHPLSSIYFISFVVITSYILLSCVSGIIFDSYKEMREKNDHQRELDGQKTVTVELSVDQCKKLVELLDNGALRETLNEAIVNNEQS